MNTPEEIENRVDEALAEYLLRIDRGELVDRDEFVCAHPDVADALRAYFADADAVARGMASESEDVYPDSAASRAAVPPLEVIRYFGDYELLDELGRGGMGVVYRARQCSLNRLVAVKMLLAGFLADQHDVERFHREAEAAANLRHPNIVAIHEVGEHEGRHYFSMDLIDGPSLATIIRDSPLPWRKAVEYVRIVSEAVAYSHAHETLHRDLKPSNILIDAEGQPHVTDFGLAKRVGSDVDLTATGAAIGTASYMSPEQARGQHDAVGRASDVYSLGATLYDLLTGRPPFRAETPVATLHAVIHDEPVPPRRLSPSIERDLDTICLKCLDKDPSRRYRSAHDLAEDLRRLLAGEAILARPIGKLERTWRWCRRNPVVAVLIATVLLLLALGTTISTSLAVLASKRAVAAAVSQECAELNYNRVFAAVDELYTEMGSDPLFDDAALKPLRKKFYEASMKQYEAFVRELGGDVRAQDKLARSLMRVGDTARELGDETRAADAYRQARYVLEELVAHGQRSREVMVDLATAYERIGLSLGVLDPYAVGKKGDRRSVVEQRKHWLTKALRIRTELVHKDPEDVRLNGALTRSQMNLAHVLADGGEHDAAVILLEEARQRQQMRRRCPSRGHCGPGRPGGDLWQLGRGHVAEQ